MDKWVDIQGFEGIYMVNDKGEIKSLDSTIIAAQQLGLHQSEVSSICRGEHIHKKGLTFRYI